MTLPIGFFTAGKSIRVKICGYQSTLGAGAGTLNIKVKLGGTIIHQTTAQNLVTGLTNTGWTVESLITCRSRGASGTVHGQGTAEFMGGSGAITKYGMVTTAAVTIDTTTTKGIDITATYSVADAGNTITATNCVVETVDNGNA